MELRVCWCVDPALTSAQPASAGDARVLWPRRRKIKPRRKPGRPCQSRDTILDGNGCVHTTLARLCFPFFQESPLTSVRSSHLTQAVESGVWDRPVEALPAASDWPTWGALRERILMNASEVRRVRLLGSPPRELDAKPGVTLASTDANLTHRKIVARPRVLCSFPRPVDFNHAHAVPT
jgi:hypothetical protein